MSFQSRAGARELVGGVGGGSAAGGGWGGGGLNTDTHTDSSCFCVSPSSPSWRLVVWCSRLCSRLFHRLKIRCFSGSLAELFLAPPIAALSVESRSVPAVVSAVLAGCF